ncbi:ABC transporter ATP-binding protein [Geomicrobium sp. JCM 19039]|uniref:ABC transporter ATP-binding protein n=1 Tax=Geomicrobium sp. JCM 19039 TaxID=1460636 RepID=UPI000AC7BE63|nr:ABC transporter ATP-binding protein [Geomicrobium sp. JCM 19039]
MEALKTVELEDYANRGVGELSGGQQQRVALARALVMEPAVLLMDEPLSNLDKKLRNTMRTTIRKIQQEVGITTIFVTHDQEEAMSMADRIAVMKDGEIIQQASPTELYGKPLTPFVADFVGSSNIYDAVQVEGQKLKVNDDFIVQTSFPVTKKESKLLIRPEGVELLQKPNREQNILKGNVTMSTYFGPSVRYDVNVGGSNIVVEQDFQPGLAVFEQGAHVYLHIPEERVLLL